MLTEPATKYPRFRAPREDNQALVVPRCGAVGQLLAANRERIAIHDYNVQGRSIVELAQSARRAVVERAVQFTADYRDVPVAWRDPQFIRTQPLFIAGHQPELVHPGVWFKNFVLGGLAHQHNGVALQLVIDTDLCRAAAIRVPTGSIKTPRMEVVSYDAQLAEQPYEERRVDDLALAAGFPSRVENAIRPFIAQPLVAQLWPHVMESLGRHGNLGMALAQGRHWVEAQWGNQTVELPASQVCELTEFRWFASHVLAQLPRFRQAYNGALADYRQVHGVRNKAQPLPNLAAADDWLESPFWVWTSQRPVRRSLWVRRAGIRLQLTDRDQIEFELELAESGDAARAVDQLTDIAARGIKLRSRALITTLFARLMLGDLFLHGIGGAKYDQVTDELARRFFGFAPPGYMTLSATLRLPIEHESVNREHLHELSHELRELTFHPEKHLESSNGEVAAIVSSKQCWIAAPTTPANAAERHHAIVAANELLQPWVAQRREALLARQSDGRERLRASAILELREYAFCLFPANDLRRRLSDLADRGA
ncbi:MAG: hypothetical protein WD851_14685 [Pirellulales bacterium]